MDIPKPEIIEVIYHLLPGFVAAWIFHALTAHPKATPFERVIQALIFTAFIQAVVIPLRTILFWTGENFYAVCELSESSAFVLSMIIAIILGVVFTTFANTNWIHDKIPDWITRRTSYPSEWFSAFNRNECYIILHLKGDRSIAGWPHEWPDQPDKGHFILEEPAWLNEENKLVPLNTIEEMLIPATEVVMVQFEKFVEVDETPSSTGA